MTQPPPKDRREGGKPLGAAELASRNLKAQTKRERSAAFEEDLGSLDGIIQAAAESLAAKYKRKVEDVEKAIRAKSFLAAERSKNLWNAKVHHLAKEMNEGKRDYYWWYEMLTILQVSQLASWSSKVSLSPLGRAVGSKYKIQDVQKAAKTHPAFQDLTTQEEEELLEELRESQAATTTGTRLSNAAAARDCTAFGKRMSREVSIP